MSTSQKVAEIFLTAGEAFRNLGAMTMQLHPNPDSQPNSKWNAAEIELLHSAVKTFGTDLNSIAERMKHRTVSQVKEKLKDQLLTSKADKDDSSEPNRKKLKVDISVAESTLATSKSERPKINADDTISDVDSVTIYSELQVDEDVSSDDEEEDDGSDVEI